MRGVRLALALAGLCAVALYLRAGTLDFVFGQGAITFLETDPWYHVRSIEHLVHNFPWRMAVDPYSSLAYSGRLATAPFFDYVIAAAAWIAGWGHPSERMVEMMAAWYPAVLGMLIVPAVFLLGRKIFNPRAGLIAAAVAATLAGHFLRVALVGYTDHHVMESLLSTIFFFLLLRAVEKPGTRAIASGLTLGAYLLTFVGGAFLIAIVIAWILYEQIRGRWRAETRIPIAPVMWTLLIALAMVAPSYRLLWMNYSIAALAGGAVAILAVEGWSRRVKSDAIFVVGVLAPVASLGILAAIEPGRFRILARLMPALAGTTGGVAELQSLFERHDAFSLRPAWDQFGGAIVLAVAGVLILGELALKNPQPRRDLVFFWGLATLVFAAGQVRMTYYFAIAAALLCGYLVDRMLDAAPHIRWAAAVGVAVFVVAPNIYQAAQIRPGESLDADWREALTWMRQHTPEPFAKPDYYYARYSDAPLQAGYSVMAWWDYGYWITALGRRVPVTNPTQLDAAAAAACLLAQDESEAAAIMEKFRSRYLIADARLVMLLAGDAVTGKFPALFLYDREFAPDDYYLIAQQRDADGVKHVRVLFRPPYFRSLLIRLFAFGGEAVEKPSPALAFVRGDGKNRELVDLREFASEQQARAAEPACRMQGCILVSTSPFESCVRLDALTRFRAVFSSSSAVVQNAKNPVRKAIQIYEFK